MTSVVQATLPLVAGAAAVVSQPIYMPSRASQQSRRSKGSCPIEVVEGLMQITQQQRMDAVQRENWQLQREIDAAHEIAREKESLRTEAAKEKESLCAEALQRQQAIRDDTRNRDKLFFESNDRDKERAMKEMQRREELARKTALDEAKKEMALQKELAEERQRSVMLSLKFSTKLPRRCASMNWRKKNGK